MDAEAMASGGQVPCNFDSGATAWVLLSTVLVLGMMPALAFFEGGLLRRINVLSILTQVFSGLAILQVMWFAFGFSLVFSGDAGGLGVIGDLHYAFYNHLDKEECMSFAPQIPALAYASFQAMFAAITPLLLTGTFAERMKFKSVIILIAVWELLVYYPVAHVIWAEKGFLARWGVLDFAGGITIHTTAGVSSLVIAVMLGRRRGFDKFHGEFPPHNVPLAAVGAALLLMGWLGFCSGSSLTASPMTSYVVANTTVASATSAVLWIMFSVNDNGHVATLDVLNGSIAGLAGVTPACGYVTPPFAAITGALSGIGSWFGVKLLKHKLRIDDALDVSSIHGIPGIIGAICIGLFADDSINSHAHDGLIHSRNGSLLGKQVAATVGVAAYSAVVTWLILRVKERLVGLKVSAEEEDLGLDFSEHGINPAYHDLHDPHHHYDSPKLQKQRTERFLRSASELGAHTRSESDHSDDSDDDGLAAPSRKRYEHSGAGMHPFVRQDSRGL